MKVRRCIHENLIAEAEAVIESLRGSGLTVVTAESCTGGLIAACLSHGKDASSCFQGGFVVYTKTQKHEVLGVNGRLLSERGAVNGEVARQLAEGALERSQACLAVSVTGVLGPDPDEDGNPPGLIYLGLARHGKPTTVVGHESAEADPDAMREWTVLKALELLRQAAIRAGRQDELTHET